MICDCYHYQHSVEITTLQIEAIEGRDENVKCDPVYTVYNKIYERKKSNGSYCYSWWSTGEGFVGTLTLELRIHLTEHTNAKKQEHINVNNAVNTERVKNGAASR